MRKRFLLATLAVAAAGTVGAPVALVEAQTLPHYEISVRIDPSAGLLEASVTLSRVGTTGPVEFALASTLEVTSSSPAVDKLPAAGSPPRGDATLAAAADEPHASRYRTRGPLTEGELTLTYRGRIAAAVTPQAQEYARGFSETSGLIDETGVFLARASYWYPVFDDRLVTFALEARAPAAWHLVSQGQGSSGEGTGVARWTTAAPMDDIYLVGGPLRVWRDRAGTVDTLVYLHEDDGALAGKYLAATAQYLQMYQELIGAYPYPKFALVENFWETGYGMPSFTLLGPSVIRFPFIITSSYPHEILHNWWGNSVFVDGASGNWSEGLTAYLADHLIQEQQGRGAAHRRATLQRYASYVGSERDFPLTEFSSRDSAASEAVGYGKTLMGAHMLRARLGDDRFRTVLRRFFEGFRGKRASFGDLQRVAEAVAGESLAPFFDDLLERPGAPTLEVETNVTREGNAYVVRGTLRQTQPAPPFAFDVPVVLQTEGAPLSTVARFGGREAAFELRSTEAPVAIHADPAYDVFRMLDPREIPPSIGQIFGGSRITAVLPASASAEDQRSWRALVESWRGDAQAIDIVTDRESSGLPPGRTTWLLGRENRLAGPLFLDAGFVRVDGDAFLIDGRRLPLAGHSAVVVRRHPASLTHAVGWIVNSVPGAFPGLGRKLPHYGRYSYLGFEGEEPVNTFSGEWVPADSPLSVDLRSSSGRGTPLPVLTLPPATPLIDPPPVFSQGQLGKHVEWLASPEREGRGIGTPGLQQAAEYIAAQFQAAGLMPGGDSGTWFQTVPLAAGPEGRQTRGVNVVGYLPGAREEWREQSALVTAHYDHLGRTSAAGAGGQGEVVHPGADDNASGVAVLLELARSFGAAGPPPRSLVFLAFTGEETGLQGARYFAAHPGAISLSQVIGVINLDTVGRLGAGQVSILGAGTATEWPHIFRGASYVTGVPSSSIAGNYEGSDQRVFIEQGIPAIQIFTGPHADYHRPGDTADKVDVPGLVKVATLVREAVAYLTERPTSLTVTIGGGAGVSPPTTAAQPAAGERRVSFGAVPDFAYAGTGVRLDGVVAGSPAAGAGLTAGDIVTRVDETPIPSLREFADVLRTLQPGQSITVVYQRAGIEHTMTVVLASR